MPTTDGAVLKPFKNKRQRQWNTLGELLDGDNQHSPEAPSQPVGGGPLSIQLDCIELDPGQPRKTFDQGKLEELAASIRENHVLQPITVRSIPGQPGRYFIKFGERRWRASRLAGRDTIPCLVSDDGEERLRLHQLVENMQREDLEPLQTAHTIAEEVKARGTGGKGELARILGISAATISNYLSLTVMPEVVRAAFDAGKCRDVSVVAELVSLHKRHPVEVQTWVADAEELTRPSVKLLRDFIAARRAASDGEKEGREAAALESGSESLEPHPPSDLGGSGVLLRPSPFPSDDAEAASSEHKQAAARKPTEPLLPNSPNVKDVEQKLRDALHAPVRIEQRSKKRGQICIPYASLAELDSLLCAIAPHHFDR